MVLGKIKYKMSTVNLKAIWKDNKKTPLKNRMCKQKQLPQGRVK